MTNVVTDSTSAIAADSQTSGPEKVRSTLAAALSKVRSGASIAVGGFGGCGVPLTAVEALCDLGVDNLHIISNNCGQDGRGLALLLAQRRIRKFTGSFPGAQFADYFQRGEVELELVPQGSLAERLRAGGAGIPAFYTPAGVGTLMADGGVPVHHSATGELTKTSGPREIRIFAGQAYLLEEALRPDVALVHAYEGDEFGNLRFRLTSRNFNPLCAMAARHTIAQVERLQPLGGIAPDDVHLPGCFVDRVVDHDAPLGLEGQRRAARIAGHQPARTARRRTERTLAGWSRQRIAARIAEDLKPGDCVNLGIGIPLFVADYIPAWKRVMLHTENGLLGMGETPPPGEADPDLIGAGKNPTTAIDGASTFDSTVSFAMVRSGRLDVSVLGALEVSAAGDIANWYVPGGKPGVGGAMDLVQGARQIWVAMEHVGSNGQSKIVDSCRYPLTGRGVATRIYTNLAIFDVVDGSLVLRELGPDVGVDDVRAATGVDFGVELWQ